MSVTIQLRLNSDMRFADLKREIVHMGAFAFNLAQVQQAAPDLWPWLQDGLEESRDLQADARLCLLRGEIERADILQAAAARKVKATLRLVGL